MVDLGKSIICLVVLGTTNMRQIFNIISLKTQKIDETHNTLTFHRFLAILQICPTF